MDFCHIKINRYIWIGCLLSTPLPFNPMLHPAEHEGGMHDQFSLKHKTPLSFELRGFYFFMACLFKGWGRR
jgi:hypothetical protein